jgi:hypothetical protein
VRRINAPFRFLLFAISQNGELQIERPAKSTIHSFTEVLQQVT